MEIHRAGIPVHRGLEAIQPWTSLEVSLCSLFRLTRASFDWVTLKRNENRSERKRMWSVRKREANVKRPKQTKFKQRARSEATHGYRRGARVRSLRFIFFAFFFVLFIFLHSFRLTHAFVSLL